jgi:hypothetical protein
VRDYRRFLSAHLQFLQGLCQRSTQLVNSSIDQFLSSSFVTTQLLSAEDFYLRISSLVNRSKTNAPMIFDQLLSLTRIVNDGNGIITRYGTNFNYIPNLGAFDYAATDAVIYDDNCSCGLLSSCTTQANFIGENVSYKIPVKGMKMGCTPSESFRLSTLECFYDQSCLDLIQEYTYYPYRIDPVSGMRNRFSVNATVNELIKDAFVEEWKTSANYSSYFHQCSPLECSYTYVEQFNLLYIITLLFGLRNGLGIVLKWICPQISRLIFKIRQCSKKRITPAQTIRTVEMASVTNVNEPVDCPNSHTESNTSPHEVSEYVFVVFTRFI